MKFGNNHQAGNSGIYARRYLATDGDDLFVGSNRADFVMGRGGNDTILDLGTARHSRDVFMGGAGNDTIRTHWGVDIVLGGSGDDLIVSRSDAGEPKIAQDPSLPTFNKGQPYGGRVTNDILTGGQGADTFLFRMDLNARPDIAAKHVDAAGNIDWHDVAGENGAPHLHWVDSIGRDVITDFGKSQGDKISIEGHTAAIEIIYRDINRDGREESIIKVTSNQGGAGSHNGDSLGRIVVYGDRVEVSDVAVNAGVHHGAYGSIDDLMVA